MRSRGGHEGPLRSAGRRAAARACLLMVLLLPAAVGRPEGAATPNAGTPAAPRPIQNLPGYRPLVDPESMSVVIGRRVNAPLVRKAFVGSARGWDALGRAVCRALHHSNRDSLLQLCIRDDEFRNHSTRGSLAPRALVKGFTRPVG